MKLSPPATGKRLWIALGVVFILAFIVPIVLFVPVHIGLKGAFVDSPKATAEDIARLAIGATQYLVTLATALFAAVGLMITGKISDLPHSLTWGWRITLTIALALLGLSLWTGFTVHQLILQAAADGVIRPALDRVLWLHMLQLIELAVAVALVGSTIVRHGILKLSFGEAPIREKA